MPQVLSERTGASVEHDVPSRHGPAIRRLSGRELVLAAFDAHSPDRVTALAQSMFFELTDQPADRADIRAGDAQDSMSRIPTGIVRDMRLRFQPTCHPFLFLACVEAELRACVAQMVEAHEERKMLIEDAQKAYDLAVTSSAIKAALVKKFIIAFWPVLLRFGVLSLLSAASVVVFKSSGESSVSESIESNSGFINVAFGVLLTMMVGYGQDQIRAFAVVRLSRRRDRAVLDAESTLR